MGVVYAFQNGRSRLDQWAYLILTALITAFIPMNISLHVIHCPRMSKFPAVIADILTRNDQKGKDLATRLGVKPHGGWPNSILTWMKDPKMDVNLSAKLLADFAN